MDPSAEVLASTADRVVVRLGWREAKGAEWRSLFRVLTFRGERIVDMEDVRTEQEAKRAAGLK